MPFARAYLALQGLAGALWWWAVWNDGGIRHATLGGLPMELAYADVPLFVVASWLAAAGSRAAVWTALVWTALVALGLFGYATVAREAVGGMFLMAAALAGTALVASKIVLGHVPTEWLVRGPFVFRPTRDAQGHLARTLRQLVGFWLAFLVLLPLTIVLLERRWRLDVSVVPPWRIVGGALFLLASALGVWSAVTMARVGEGTPLPCAAARRLVVAGPYRFVRNPMAVAGIAQGTGVGLMLGSPLVVLYALAGSVIWNWAVRPHEEADLAARFGAEFEGYRRVRCWWPTGRRVIGSLGSGKEGHGAPHDPTTR